MISTAQEYESAKGELIHLEEWLSRLQQEHPAPSHGLSKAGIRKMIARLHEELAHYEGSQEVQSAIGCCGREEPPRLDDPATARLGERLERMAV